MKKSNVLVIGDVKHAEEDIIGKKFNRWTILSIKEPVRGTSRKCICRCECGKEKDVDLYTVRKGTSRSCGCETARGNEKVPGHANCTVSYHNYKHQARYRNINFELTRDQYKKIVE